jgi:hypothetical protein
MMPTAEIPIAETPKASAEGPPVGRLISSDSIPVGGFTPGTILSDRYRIIGLLGRGGMGEVYRADDLKLGQPVALKFLPPKLAADPVRRERFFAEVRITRQLSHPNICRVYDISEVDGRHFLSMEYIDGEDLASLLKRIGHLSNEKALDIARQLAAGLAAAHERGVLHRDLKPANIMLDGHGRVRITDFGLAIAAGDEMQAAEIAGTPAYMAPEQLAGKGATVRSDMYSLGLVLYEIYTGKKAFTATTLAELRQQKETHTPRAISEIREGMDPVVERLIRRCMERDPNARPASVAQLALALPGGDPLAAAIAAGETPSPEMVAASGGKEGLRPAVAWSLLLFIIVGTLAAVGMNDRFHLYRRLPFNKRPETLVERSHEILKKAGYPEEPADSVYGFIYNENLLRYIEDSDKTANRWKNLDSKAILFWYRQGPQPLGGSIELNPTYYEDFSSRYSGEVRVVLDTEGRLVSLRGVPTPARSSAGTLLKPDWAILFAEAGLDIAQWTPADVQVNPPFYVDTIAAWQGSIPNRPGTPVRVEAAALQGRPVYFEITGLWNQASQTEPVQTSMSNRIATAAFIFFLTALIIGGLFFARRNLRLGRGDRRYATRLALFMGAGTVLASMFGAHHVSTIWEFVRILFIAIQSLIVAGLFWVLYIALEPFVRRKWPQILVSWTRLLSGEWRDPLVSRDALVGCAFGVFATCIWLLGDFILPLWLGHAEFWRPVSRLEATTGIHFFLQLLITVLGGSILTCFGLVALLFFLRVLLRNQIAALAVCFMLWPLIEGGSQNYGAFAVNLVLSANLLFVLMRFGLVAAISTYVYCGIVMNYFPITLEASAWYSGYGYAVLAILAVFVLYSFRTSLGGRSLLAVSPIDD